jgi:hypothetical protein
VAALVSPAEARNIRFNKRAKMQSIILSRGEIFGFLMEQIKPRDDRVLDRLPDLKAHIEDQLPDAARTRPSSDIFPEKVHVLPGEDDRADQIFVTLGDRGSDIEPIRFAAQQAVHQFFELSGDRETVSDYWQEGNTPPPGYIFMSFKSTDPDNTEDIIGATEFAIAAVREDQLSYMRQFEYEQVTVTKAPLTRN